MTRSSTRGAVSLLAPLLLLLSGSCAPDEEPPFDSLVAAERSFAASSLTDGTRSAFLQYLAGDAIVFNQGPVNGREIWESRPEDESVLTWGPAVAEISADGDLGYTSGPWSLSPEPGAEAAAWGHYVSVWKRSGEGEWRVAVDGGIIHGEMTAPPEGPVVRVGPPEPAARAPTSPDSAVRVSALAEMDDAYSAAIASAGFPAAMEEFAAPWARVYRNGSFPFATLDLALAADAVTGGEESVWNRMETHSSRAGDLGFTVGVVEFQGTGEGEGGTGSASFYRIWRGDEQGKWQVVLDLIIPG